MRIFLSLFGLVVSGLCQAESSGPFDYRFGLFGGAYFAEVDTNLRWDSSLIEGTEIGLESNLGMKDNDSAFNGGLEWRFFNRHALSLNYFKLTRSGVADAPFNIIIDGETIPVGAEVSSSFKAKVTSLKYDFAFIKRENLMLDVGLGLSIQDLGFAIQAEDDDVFEQGDVTAPLPTITFGLKWAITPSFIANLDLGWFDLKIDNVKGEITELNTGVTWKRWENVGFNLAYNYFDVSGRVTDEEGDFEGRLNYEFSGPIVGIIATF
jgi:hypothetical protein